jgi:hypothetical protein
VTRLKWCREFCFSYQIWFKTLLVVCTLPPSIFPFWSSLETFLYLFFRGRSAGDNPVDLPVPKNLFNPTPQSWRELLLALQWCFFLSSSIKPMHDVIFLFSVFQCIYLSLAFTGFFCILWGFSWVYSASVSLSSLCIRLVVFSKFGQFSVIALNMFSHTLFLLSFWNSDDTSIRLS